MMADITLRAYPKTEQKATSSVEDDMEVFSSLHGGGYALRLDGSVCRCRRKCGSGSSRCCPGTGAVEKVGGLA